jgi:RNA polymerase sigma factor (sigma-70 family)
MKDTSKPSDGELLAVFAGTGDEAAFAELIGRHGAMVQGVCLRVLGNFHEAQDVTQAVFVTLARKAASLRKDPSVGGWLHHVAICLARNVRAANYSRQRREEQAMQEVEVSAEPCVVDTHALRAELDDAIGRLPERYRLPLVLFHLEERSLEQTAQALALNIKTASTRLVRGREMLRKKLIRRGVTVGAIGALIPLLSTEAGAAVLPATFVSATVQAASLAATGKLATGIGTGVVSAKVAALTKGAIQMLFIAQLKTAALITAACVVVAGGGVIVAKEVLTPAATPATAQAEPKGSQPATATNGAATIAWGAVTNELQAGLVPLGGITGWKGFLCPNHPPGERVQPISSAIAARNRHCVECVALKPWSATFIEGEPMRMELHFRNLAKEVVNLYDARYGGCWRFAFTPVGGGTSWQAGWAIKDIRRAESFAQSTIQLAAGQQNAVELDLGPGWMFSDPQGRQPAIRSLPVGKYTMTATYAHPDHAQRKICTYWHGTVTTGTVQIEIKADDAEARFLEAAKYAGFAAVAEVKALPQAEQAGDAAKLSQLGIEWKELLYAPDATRQALSVVNALTFPNTAAAELKIGDRILVAGDKVTRYVLPGGGTLTFEGQSPEVLPNNGGALLDGAQWLLWTQSRQDALQAALAPGWRKGACPWCHRGADSDYPVCACRNGCEGKGCTQRQKQRGGCIVTAKGGGFCERKVGPATRDVTFRLWAYDPKAERDLTPRNECRIKDDASVLLLWIEVQNEKGSTPEFQTPGGGARFDCCKTLFYLVEGPGLSAPTPSFHGDGGALARMMGPAALQKGSATGRADLIAGTLFTTPGTYTVRAVAGRLVSNPVKVEVRVGAFKSLQGESMRIELTNEEAHQLAVRLANEKFAKKAFIDPMTGNKLPTMSIDLPPGEKTNNRWLFLRSAPAGIFAKVSFDLDGSNPVVEVDYARE